MELNAHTSFVYSVSVLSTGELVSSGEDRSVRIWKGKKECDLITSGMPIFMFLLQMVNVYKLYINHAFQFGA